MPEWEHFAHQADIGVRGYGASTAEAFEQAALAMTAAITDVDDIRTVSEVHVECEAARPELLLVEWLNALIYEMATRGMLFGRFAVCIEDTRLRGEAWGEPLDVERHRPATEVKGATYTALDVSRCADGRWRAQCVVDV